MHKMENPPIKSDRGKIDKIELFLILNNEEFPDSGRS